MKKVLIGIISKNRAQILPKAIESALNQRYPLKEIAVFDDCSTDATAELIKEYPQIRWIFSETPKGYVYGRNLLMGETDADYYCSLDDDSWFLKGDELELAIEYLDTHPQTAAIAFDILSPDKPNSREIAEPYETNMYIGCGHVLRISTARELGLYYKFPGFYGVEEKDLCIGFIHAGHQVIQLPGVNVWHDKTTVSRDLPKQHRSGVFNDLVFTYRRAPFSYLPWIIALKIFKHIRFALTFKEHNLKKPSILAIKDFFAFLGTHKIERAAVSLKTLRKFNSVKK